MRKQLESQVITIDALRSENRAAVEHHENVWFAGETMNPQFVSFSLLFQQCMSAFGIFRVIVSAATCFPMLFKEVNCILVQSYNILCLL